VNGNAEPPGAAARLAAIGLAVLYLVLGAVIAVLATPPAMVAFVAGLPAAAAFIHTVIKAGQGTG
jgi:hypothetical protein